MDFSPLNQPFTQRLSLHPSPVDGKPPIAVKASTAPHPLLNFPHTRSLAASPESLSPSLTSAPKDRSHHFGPQRSLRRIQANSSLHNDLYFLEPSKTQEDLEVRILDLSQQEEKTHSQKHLKAKLLFQCYQHSQFKNLNFESQLLCYLSLLQLKEKNHYTFIKIKLQDLRPILENAAFLDCPKKVQTVFHAYLTQG